MPGDPGATVVTNARATYSTRAAAGATGTRHSPLPSWGSARSLLGDERFLHNSGAMCRGNAEVYQIVTSRPATDNRRVGKAKRAHQHHQMVGTALSAFAHPTICFS